MIIFVPENRHRLVFAPIKTVGSEVLGAGNQL